MSELPEPVAQLTAAVDSLLELDLPALGQDGLTYLAQAVEVQRRRLVAVDHRLISELDGRGVCHELLQRDTATMTGQLLRLDPREARRRVSARMILVRGVS